jgi:protein gp37
MSDNSEIESTNATWNPATWRAPITAGQSIWGHLS